MADVELVVAALAAGATAGITDVAGNAVRDTYTALQAAVRRHLAQRGRDVACIDGEAGLDPVLWQAHLTDELEASGPFQDDEVLNAAQRLLQQIGTAAGNIVDARGAKGVMLGDHNTQTNTFN